MSLKPWVYLSLTFSVIAAFLGACPLIGVGRFSDAAWEFARNSVCGFVLMMIAILAWIGLGSFDKHRGGERDL